LDLIHTGDDLDFNLTTADMVFDVLECIDHHMRSDRLVQAHLGTPHAPFIMDPQINIDRRGIYQARRIHIPSRPAFERFLQRIVLHARSNNTIAIVLRATKSFEYNLFFAQQILCNQVAEVTLTICVESGPLVSKWRAAINERINHPWRVGGWQFCKQVPLQLRVLPAPPQLTALPAPDVTRPARLLGLICCLVIIACLLWMYLPIVGL
jgi:hypothetical protein